MRYSRDNRESLKKAISSPFEGNKSSSGFYNSRSRYLNNANLANSDGKDILKYQSRTSVVSPGAVPAGNSINDSERELQKIYSQKQYTEIAMGILHQLKTPQVRKLPI